VCGYDCGGDNHTNKAEGYKKIVHLGVAPWVGFVRTNSHNDHDPGTINRKSHEHFGVIQDSVTVLPTLVLDLFGTGMHKSEALRVNVNIWIL